MKGKNIIFLVIAFIISGILVTVNKNNINSKNVPIEGYRVYLEGKSIGLISSKEELNQYINNQQEKIKTKYNVDTVYIPNDIDILKEITFEDKIDSIESIYKKINDISPFTIKGYQVTIDKTNSKTYHNDDNKQNEEEKIIKFNILSKEIFNKAVENVILSFVSDEQYSAFKENQKLEFKDTGELIENIYIEDEIYIKEMNLPVNEMIYMDADELTKYLIFNNNSSDQTYKVKNGDSLEKIANNNKMSVNELLIANSSLSSKSTLLYVGQELSIGLVNPIFTTIVEKHVVSDQVVKFKTVYEYDNNMYQGQTRVKQNGSDGKIRVTQKLKVMNGEIAQAYIVSSEDLVPVVNKIVVRGGKQVRRGDGEWSWPTNFPYMISSGYGWRWGTLHRGVDIIGTGRGSPVYAARDGIVTNISYHWSMGYYVTIMHENGYYTQYLHMQNINGNDYGGSIGSATKYISIGDRVQVHQVIGEIGSSGESTGVHLHFEIWEGVPYGGGQSFDPLLFY